MQIIADKIPEIAPWIKKGPLINQFDAPTNFWILISSFCFIIDNLIVLKVISKAKIDIKIKRVIPDLLMLEVKENMFSIKDFL